MCFLNEFLFIFLILLSCIVIVVIFKGNVEIVYGDVRNVVCGLSKILIKRLLLFNIVYEIIVC